MRGTASVIQVGAYSYPEPYTRWSLPAHQQCSLHQAMFRGCCLAEPRSQTLGVQTSLWMSQDGTASIVHTAAPLSTKEIQVGSMIIAMERKAEDKLPCH